MKRLGFACKFSELNSKKQVVSVPELNTRTTTISWLNTRSRSVAEDKLWELLKHNIEATRKAVKQIGDFNESLRMFRISSDVLPAYTHDNWRDFYNMGDVQSYLEKEFAKVGETAQKANVKLSFHPGQFCCIVSDRSDVVANSLDELEYHATMARMMGYGKSKLDFKINVHLSGKQGIDGFDAAWSKMSPELRNCLTLENDEYQTGIDTLLLLKDKVGIVLDIHHHFIHTGEYIQSTDPRIQQIIESWQGVRPTIHYSQSKDEFTSKFTHIPTMAELLAFTSKGKLRSHSDFYNHNELNKWALTHLEWADIMAESKAKNLASQQLYDYWQTIV